MSVIAVALALACGLAAAGAAAGLFAPARGRAALSGVCTAALGCAGASAGVAALSGRTWSASLPGLLPLAGVHLAVDALSGLFMAVSGLVVAAVSVYAIGADGGRAPRQVHAALPLLALALVLVPVAASASTFLVLWELMAFSSLVLVVAEHRERAEVRRAGVWYAVMTQLGLVAILSGLALFAAGAHGETFGALRAGAAAMPAGVRGAVFVLTAAGFASKAGVVPLHAWLPRAYREAPSQATATMSAAMVGLAVYGIVRVDLDLLGGGPRWWGAVLLVAGAVSAVYGALQAAVASDLRVLLAYSSTENMGLVLVGLGTAELLAASGDRPAAAVALTAALLHVVNHAGFKALGFCVAGSVRRATGSCDLDALGGLRRRLPVTTGAFAVVALCAVALPPGNAFVSEWLLLQSLLHGLAAPGVTAAVLFPVALGAIALSSGIAATAFVKALGVGFFARPRGARVADAREAPWPVLAGTGLLAGACLWLGLAPAQLARALSAAAAVPGAGGTRALTGRRLALYLPGVSASSLAPLWPVLALLALVAAGLGLLRFAATRPRRSRVPVWDCGAGAPTARMQYTATSFAEPLQRVFDDVLAPEQDVDVTPVRESAYLVERIRFQRRMPDRVEHRLYLPVLAAVGWVGERARGLAPGSAHRYLAYGFAVLTVLLAGLAVTR